MDCNHDWWVFWKAEADHALLVECLFCLAIGSVDDPSEAEYRRPAEVDGPYKYSWPDPARVQIRKVLPMEGVGEDG